MSRERRKHVRKRVKLSGIVRGGEEGPRDVTIVDMSLGGAFVAIEPPPPFGAAVTLEFELGGERLALGATVRWAKPGGVGLQFGSLGARDTYLMTDVLAKAEAIPDSRRPDDD